MKHNCFALIPKEKYNSSFDCAYKDLLVTYEAKVDGHYIYEIEVNNITSHKGFADFETVRDLFAMAWGTAARSEGRGTRRRQTDQTD